MRGVGETRRSGVPGMGASVPLSLSQRALEALSELRRPEDNLRRRERTRAAT